MGQEIKIFPAGDPNPKRVPSAIQGTPLPGRESVNFVQFSALMGVLNAYMAFLTNNRMADVDQPHGGPLDGGVKASAESTFIGICSRVDSLLEDESRWGMRSQDSLESSLLSLYADQRENIRLQKESMLRMDAPHIRFRPTLIQMADGQWAAYYGNPAAKQELVVGVGPNPEAAVRHYDEVFIGKEYEQNTKAMDENGRKVPEGQPGSADLPGDSNQTGPGKGLRKRKNPKAARPRRGKSRGQVTR